MKNVKNNNGITLMALVITIIILIILASIGTYSGIQVVKSAQFTAFSTELKIMQTQVNKLYEEKKNGNDDVDALGKTISSSSTTVQSNATKAFNALEITDTSDYKYFDTDTIKSLNIEGVEGEFFVNIDKRSVVSYDGFEYEGKTYYTLEQLPDGLYNVEHNTSEQQPDFNVDYELLENGKCKISVNNINYNGNINKWQVKYKKEEEENWKQINSYSFTIDELGNYRVKIANNNIESREKQIMAKSSQLPSEYQQVEYIESTGTQWIDTGFNPNNNTSIYIKIKADGYFDKVRNVAGSRNMNTDDKFGIISFSSTNKFGYFFGNQSFQSQVDIDDKIHEFELDKDKFMVDNEILTYPTNNEFEVPYTIFLFGFNNSNNQLYNSYKLYNCKIKDKNILKRYFVPCYRKLDKKPGLFDLVNNEFYTNQGTGEFLTTSSIKNNNLPSEYQQVEYLESTGTQYIDTLVYPSNNTSFFIKIRAGGQFENAKNVAGSRINNTNNKFGIISFYSTNKFGYFFGSQSFQSQVDIDNKIHEFELDKDKFMVDNEILTYPTNNEFEVPYTIWLFGFHNDINQQYNSYRLYDCKIIDNNINKEFIPCKRKSDNMLGLFDLANNEFYTNQGTGDFISGDDIHEEENIDDGDGIDTIIINDV